MSNTGKAFEDRVIWITGAGSGMGEATALRFAEDGASLVLVDLAADRLERVAAEATARGCKADALAGDLRDPDTAARAGALIAAKHGRLDMLVNCAGFNVPNRRWSQLTPVDANAVTQTNLTALFYTTTMKGLLKLSSVMRNSARRPR